MGGGNMKKAIKKMPLVYPLPITLLGTLKEGQVFYTTVSNVLIMEEQPPVVGIMLETKHAITETITTGSMLSINYPSTTMIAQADLCANVSTHAFDKSSMFDTKYWLETPYIDECPAALIVEVESIKDITRHHKLIQCLVRRTLLEETIMVDDHIPSLNILDPLIYGQDDTYYKVGKVIGKVSSEGKKLYHKLRKTVAPEPYSFYFKLNICQLKDEGKSYRYLADKYDVYHETIEDWYALYSLFGREGLTKKFSHKLATSSYSQEEKHSIAKKIINHDTTYREACKTYMVSLSRLKNWVKKERKRNKRA